MYGYMNLLHLHAYVAIALKVCYTGGKMIRINFKIWMALLILILDMVIKAI